MIFTISDGVEESSSLNGIYNYKQIDCYIQYEITEFYLFYCQTC